MRLTPKDMSEICSLVEILCGIHLDDSKGYLIESRLSDLARRYRCESYSQLARLAWSDAAPSLAQELIDAITTNETSFFRDGSTFDTIRDEIAPRILQRKNDSSDIIRVWSAGCSTGQEPYSVAMIFDEAMTAAGSRRMLILATDISSTAIKKAGAGHFDDRDAARGLDANRLDRHFQRDSGGWQIREPLRQQVIFERRNLLRPFSDQGPFDLVLCRNVAIYMSLKSRDDLFRRISRVLHPAGFLFVGTTERLDDLAEEYAPVFAHQNGVQKRLACYRARQEVGSHAP